MPDQNHTIPQTMTAIEITEPGGPEVLKATTRPVPRPTGDEVLIRIAAAGVNGPDVLQRKGQYAPPPGASDIPGLEVAGIVVACGEKVKDVQPGAHVAALIPGGGYAEYCTAHATNVLPLPPGLSLVEAAALPETFMTVWLNMFQRGQFKAGDIILIHGGASGIGTTATMLAKAFGAAKIITTVGSEEHRQASLKLGADVVVLRKEEDFVEVVKRETDGHGADIIIDIVAGDYIAKNYAAAAMNGHIVQIGVIGGVAKEVDLFPLLSKQLTHIGSTLRQRTPAQKAELINALSEHVLPLVEQGKVKPQIFKTFPLEAASDAHAMLAASAHVGKVVLTTDALTGE